MININVNSIEQNDDRAEVSTLLRNEKTSLIKGQSQ